MDAIPTHPDLAEGLGDEVLVRERHDRHAHAGEAPELGGEHAAGVDHDLRLDRPPRRPPRTRRPPMPPPVSTSMPVARVWVKIRQPPARALSASAVVSSEGSR